MRKIEICPICASNKTQLVYKSTLPSDILMNRLPDPYSAHYRIIRCDDCDLLRSSPVLTDEGISNLYKCSNETNVSKGEEDNVKRTMKLYYNLADPFLKDKERILDIGCDMGYLLEAAKEAGFKDLYGLEPNHVAREKARRIWGAKIGDSFYEETNYPEKFFDLIVIIHVLDHLLDPGVALERAYANLKPGGIITAVVHNIKSLLSIIMREKFPPFNLYHFYYFSMQTLQALFEKHGFEIIEVISTNNSYSLGFFAERFPLLPKGLRGAFRKVLEKVKLSSIPITIPIGNIGIIARRPFK